MAFMVNKILLLLCLFSSTAHATHLSNAYLYDSNANGLTSQVNGAKQALDVGIDVSGVQVDPRTRTWVLSHSTDTVDVNNITGTISLPTGAATAAGLTAINTTLGSPFQAGGSIGNTAFIANAGTNLNTSALAIESGGHLASIDSKTPALGQALDGASVPVVLPADQVTALTPPTTVTVNQGSPGVGAWPVEAVQTTGSNLHVVVDSAPTTAVTGTFFQATQPVSGSLGRTWALSSGTDSVAISGSVTATNASIGTNGSAIPASSTQIAGSDGTDLRPIKVSTAGVVSVDGSGVTQPVSGSVTANAGTNLNTSALALESGGHLASIDGKLPALGQALAAASVPVVLTALQVTALTPPTSVAVTQGTATSLNATVVTTGGVTIAKDSSLSTINTTLGSPFQAGGSIGNTSFIATQGTGTNLHTVVDSGAITANIGTTNGLALDTSVNGLLVGQASTTAGQSGPLTQGAVTTTAPTYTNAKTSPLSLTTAGALRVDASATTQPVSGTVTANAGTNLNTSLLALESGGNLAGINGKLPALGQALAAGSVPVVLTALQLTALTPLTSVAVTQGTAASLNATVVTTGGVTIAKDSSVTAINTTLGTPMQNSGGSVTANAGTNLNTSALALESGGHLASVDTKTPALGQALAAGAVPVVLTALQVTALTPPTSVTVTQGTGTNLHAVIDSGTISLPALAATSTNQATEITSLATIATETTAISGQLPASLGAKTIANSMAVTVASDQVVTTTDNANGSATGGAAGTKSELAGGIYNTSPPALTNGQQAAIQLDASGREIVDLSSVGGSAYSLGQAAAASSAPVALANEDILDQYVTGFSPTTAVINTNILLAAANSTASSDLQQYRTIAFEVVTGTSTTAVVINFEGSNDNANFVAVPMYDQASTTTAPVTTFTTVASTQRYFTGPINFRYFRARAVTAITAGTIQAFSMFRMSHYVNVGPISTLATAANQTTGNTSLSTIATNSGTQATAANQSTGNTSLSTIATNTTQLAQASTTAGQSGPLTQGAVTTAAPTYTTLQTDPLSLNTAGGLRVDGSGVTQPVSIATAPVLIAGSAIIGKVGIDQTTVGTTNGVSIAQVGATTVATGNGTSGAGNIRVNIASDNTAFSVNTTPVAGATDTQTTGTVSTVITLTAPSNAQGFILQNLQTSTANVRFAMGATATTTLGMQLAPGQDSGFVPTSASVTIVAESGTQNYNIQWVAK